MDEQGGAGLSQRMVLLVADARMQWAELDRRIASFDAVCPLCEGERRGAGWLRSPESTRSWHPPLSPPSGGRKASRGNKYLRRQLIHGARAALPYVADRDTPLGRWGKGS